MELNQPVKKRRPRYRGTHPRSFDEKYKELNPQKYADEIQKVFERGQTPAGMHRPICVNEIIDKLNPKPGQVGLDATLGYGGHSEEILKRITPGGRLFATDVDPLVLPKTEARLRSLGYNDDCLFIKRMNFAGLAQLLPYTDKGFDFILADLGVSSMQLDTPSRGFSYKFNAPLDLRMNPRHGQPASELLRRVSENELIQILTDNSDEPYASILAKAISAQKQNIATTRKLADLIRFTLGSQKVPAEQINKSIQRVFQALRIEVNDEFGVLDQFLDLIPVCLKPQGKVAILTFHSGEDRRVKKSFQKYHKNGIFAEIARRPIRPGPSEQRSNPRSTCAKLRWAIKAA